jgi:eukaryotic-like serine/threonine-protein kinase
MPVTRVLAPSGIWPASDERRPEAFGLPAVDTIIGGRYRVLREIGRGGMGVVYEAAHCVTDVRSALKVLLPEVYAASEAQRRFVREVKVGARLKHRHIVSAYDAGIDGKWLFMVMELLHGESLEARLKQQARLSAEECVRILSPCMRGVARAHAAGIVHRDLKPANIFLCHPEDGEPNEEPKVLDFGVLSDIGFNMDSWVTSRGIPIGTPPYMSVDQLRARPARPQFDIHAFGVILYQILSGRLPFQADTLQDLIVKINTQTPTSLDLLSVGISPGLAEVAARAMSRDPEGQYRSLNEMLDALTNAVPSQASVRTSRRVQAISSAPRSTESETTFGPAERTTASGQARRTRRFVALALGASLCGAVGAYGWATLSDSAAVGTPVTPTATPRAPEPTDASGAKASGAEPSVEAPASSQAIASSAASAPATSEPSPGPMATQEPAPITGSRATRPAKRKPARASSEVLPVHEPGAPDPTTDRADMSTEPAAQPAGADSAAQLSEKPATAAAEDGPARTARPGGRIKLDDFMR